MKSKRPYWYRGTEQEWNALSDEQHGVIWSQRPQAQPEIEMPSLPPSQLSRIERKLDMLLKHLGVWE